MMMENKKILMLIQTLLGNLEVQLTLQPIGCEDNSMVK